MQISKDDEVFRAPVRAWGSSVGVVVPHTVAKRLKLKPNQWVRFVIPKE